MIHVGIDPGLSGAIAFLYEGEADLTTVFDMPIVQISKKGFVKNALDVNALARLFLEQGVDLAPNSFRVYMERVNAFPGQGVSSMFSLGMSFWGAAGVIAGLGLSLQLVEAKDWKGHYKLSKDKELARGLAARLYPAVDLSKKKHHGRAEALLIAKYGKEKN